MKLTITILLLSLAQLAQAQTSTDNPRLRNVLKDHPEADANGDGVLTLEEARAFQKNNRKNGGASDENTNPADGDGTSHIYKTVGK